MAQALSSLHVKPVAGKKALRQFIHLPRSIYRDDPRWIPPLLTERRHFLSPANPYFAHARYRSWIAYRGDEPVGRISAQIDQLHLKRYQDDTGFFGMLEARDDPMIFRTLMNAAETWLRDQGLRQIQGPYNLSINQELGLLVDGFDTPPMIMMGHAHPYYAARIEEQDYVKAIDLLAYLVNSKFQFPAGMRAIMKRAAPQIHLRQLNRSQISRDLDSLRDIFEDAWSQNWGFIPFTKAEFDHVGRDLKLLVPDDLVWIAEVDAEPAAMMVTFPNFNEAIRDLDGRLFPLGWMKLLWRLKVAFPKTARVPLMGVRRKYQKSRMGAALALMLIKASQKHALQHGIQQVELSWILEDNLGMQSILEGIGASVYKRYRIYTKKLG